MKKYIISKDRKEKIKKKIVGATNANEKYPLPKYSAQIFNIISNTAQATRPSVVGQMSDIIPNFIEDFSKKNDRFPDHSDWKKFYLKEYAENYEAGLDKLLEYVELYKEAMEKILTNKELAKIWYDKFLSDQNFDGFQYEEMVYEFIKSEFSFDKKPYSIRNSSKTEESKGIDFIVHNSDNGNELFFNSKPASYSVEEKFFNLSEEIIIVKYSVKDENIQIEINEEDVKKIESL